MSSKAQRTLISGEDLSTLSNLIPGPIDLLLVANQVVDSNLTVRIYSVQQADGSILIFCKCNDGVFTRIKTGVFRGKEITVEHLRKVWQGLKVAELSVS